MQFCRSFKLLLCAGLFTSAALSGCGGSSNPTETIPTTVSIFYSHSVIFRNNSTMTMGYNAFGQLGDGTLTSRSTAVHVQGLRGMTKGVIGAEHTLVFGNNSSVMAWGYNGYGQLGNGDSGSTAFSNIPVKVALGALVDDVAAGGYHSLAVADGVIKAWGYNGYGQLGIGNSTNQPSPVPVVTGEGGADLTPLTALQVAAGGTHSLALFEDRSVTPAVRSVYAWGNNDGGQLGFSNLTSGSISSPKKVSLPAVVGTLKEIAAGGRFSLALEEVRDGSGRVTDQTLWGWGYNPTGELGKSPAEGLIRHTPIAVHSVDETEADPLVIKKFKAGLNHVLLLMGRASTGEVSDGTWIVRALGFNTFGQLGDNTTINSFTLVHTLNSETMAALTGVTDILAFGNHSLALANGAWYGWGNNGLGQLGNPIPTDRVGYLQTAVRVQF